ncbi:MAG: hypothetical protein V4501_12910 [Pseudomonadota bacterium]
MVINLLKFVHMLLILSLTGATMYCLVLVASQKFALTPTYIENKIYLLNRIILWTATFAILTGTLLVYPKNFTFHTEWIQAAYGLAALFTSTLGLLIWLAKKGHQQSKWLWLLAYLFLAVILVIAIHDAVTKTTLLSMASHTTVIPA